ncbi:uncharacterized protein LOC141596685 [Silene latifolia]|uniref:uncharacterized protein LOC141596685 n=1 Tax=Silene latifolia TaxID=37657 RepID=UPI003D774119
MMEVDVGMEGLSDFDEKIGSKSGFLDKVFSWSIDDIFNDDLYQDQVNKIPESFETVTEYFSSFIYPLLEETRADLCSSLEIISRAPYAEVLSYNKIKPRGDSLLYDINVDGWRNKFNDRGKEPYKTLPDDVFALVKFRPETYDDLQMVARTWVLASVTKIPRSYSEDDIDEESSSTIFTVETSKDISVLDDDYTSLFLIFLTNTITYKRIWKALHMHVNLNIIGGVLQRNPLDGDMHDCRDATFNGLSENLLMDLSSKLNPSQIEAVSASLQATECYHKSQVQLVWGPPGTGKTKTIGTLLYLLLKKNIGTLTCAPTNVAITEVASRVLDLVRNYSEEDSAESFGFLGNILLFGNKQRLRVSSDIEDIYLDYRVKRLAECFAPLTGWRSCFPCLSTFLEKCVSDYEVFVDNELIKLREQGIEDAAAKRLIDSFLDFVKSRFIAAAKNVRRCISIFSTHISRRYIGECNVEYMRRLLGLLYSFEEMLLKDYTDSEELLKLFSGIEAEDSQLDMLPLIEVQRRQCISVLKTLHRSLGDLDLPYATSYESLTEMCFRMASLIFCTASSSSKLYYMPIEPLSLLVIDEAAQLKECESAIPLQLRGLRHAILFGDECQLPAMVKSNVSAEAGFGRSLFRRLSLLGSEKYLLNMQYRMHPSISAFPNTEFYFNQILDAPSVRSKVYERQYLAGPMFGPYSFINISAGQDEVDDDGRSRRNMVEAAVVAKLLKNLYKTWNHSAKRIAIGIVSPYAAQVVAIEDLLGKRYENLPNFAVKVKSVDGFQGGEEDIIILSTVRANNTGQVGFISDCQRTNVALTRARHCLWVLGNERTLVRSDSIWKKLVCNAQARNCLFNAEKDKSLAEAMINMKDELNQLDDLLNKDSIIFKSARWKVLFSDNFVKSFSKLPSTRAKKSVMNVLVKLSNGWRPKKIRVDPVCDSAIQIVKQYKVEGRYIISTIDIIKEVRYFQVMKIWDIVSLEDVSALVKRLDNVYGAFTNDFLSRCKERSLEGDVEVPTTWSTSMDIVRHKNISAESRSASDDDLDPVNYAENSKVSESLILMKFYSLSAGTVGHLLSDSDGQALELPFEVTDQEKEIILHDKSSFILGRSGTGKTTVLTMKLFQKEQLHQMALEGLSDGRTLHYSHSKEILESESVLRQLFVTVSPKLCFAIKQHVSHLKSFARGENSSSGSVSNDIDDLDNGEQFMDIPDSFVAVPPKSYPLVITFNKFLLMIDGTLGASFFNRYHDDEVESSGCASRRTVEFLMKRKEVNYDKFCMFYWPHFNSQLTKKLDASKVFIEIISCIKGGLLVGETLDGRLTLEDYLNLSQGRTSTLNHEKRDAIYRIFLDYEKMKLERREFDLADFVNDLHRRLQHERYDGDFIDYVYIDEVQDLTMRQIALFKYVCRNVDEGFVFSGDTAQTIARGIDFRFQDVRCLFYKEFLVSETNHERSGIHEKGYISPIFQLSENFRTHAGILKLGQSVIDLIYHFFPHSIDILSPETSRIFGEAPILLESGSDENAIVTIFGNNDNVSCNLVGFGAEQVILVRDESLRQEISSYVGKNALVLTIVECKGLEFQDVLLYNFFGSSPLRNQWRVIYEYMNVKDLFDSASAVSFPEFSSEKHNVLCSELKQLYVAITRTRQRLWICENKEDLSKPMFDYWKKKCVVQVRELDDALARAMQVASSPEEWKARGKKLLAVENYEVATMCFERAGDKHWETLAKALGLKASATRMNELNPEEASNILRQAGELFESISVYWRAAECYFELKEFYKAGNLYFQHCDDSYRERAGKCFTLAGCYELAATVYAKCNRFSECLSSCTDGKLFDMGLQYIQYWKQQNTATDLDMIEQVFLENCALSQLQQDDKKGMMKFVKAFCSEDSMRAFLKKYGCFDEQLILEEELGNFSKAADIARERGEFLLEAEFLHKGGLFNEACEYFLWHVFAGCLWAKGSKGWPFKQFEQKEELLLKAKASAHSSGEQLLYKNACADVLIFLDRNYLLSQLHEFLISFQNRKNLRGVVISTRKILDLILHTHPSKYELEIDLVTDPAMHSLQRISQDKVSFEMMIYFWKSWQETMLTILNYFDAFETNESDHFLEVGEFCLNYLGVRKLPSNTGPVYVCLHPDAEWLKEVNKGFFKKFGKLVSINVPQLLAAGRNHWSTELFSTGMNVLRVLDELQKRGKVGVVSEFSKARIVQLIYEVAQLLSSFKSAKTKHQESVSLQKYSDYSMETYFFLIFPLDWRRVASRDFICLREMKVSSNILEGFILMNLEGKEELTYGQLGRVAMGLLGMPMCKTDLYETVVRRLPSNFPWKSFFEVLSTWKQSVPIGNRSEAPEISLACKLLGSLSDAYRANWRARDYISPYCFLYLADRLMVSLLELQGRMFITRSSLVEWFTHLGWKGGLIKNLSANKGKLGIVLNDAYNFLARVVHHLLANTRQTVEWVKNAGIIAKDNFPVLLLRLVIMLSLIHLNKVKNMSYKDKLQDVLSRGEVTSQLPPVFREALRKRTTMGIINAIALALKSIGDPLVIVSIGAVSSPLSCKDAIFLDIDNQNKEDLLRILFPSNVNATQGRVSDHQASANNQEMEVKDSASKIIVDWNVWELFETLKLAGGNNEKCWQKFVSNAANVKVQVDKLHDLLRTVSAAVAVNESCDDYSRSMLAESECMLLELRLLSAVLATSGQQLKDSMLLIRDSTEKLLSGKQAFEYFISPLIPQVDPVKHQTDNVEEVEIDSKADQEATFEEADDTSPATDGNQGSSKGAEKNKGKPNKKRKPKKKGKKK